MNDWYICTTKGTNAEVTDRRWKKMRIKNNATGTAALMTLPELETVYHVVHARICRRILKD